MSANLDHRDANASVMKYFETLFKSAHTRPDLQDFQVKNFFKSFILLLDIILWGGVAIVTINSTKNHETLSIRKNILFPHVSEKGVGKKGRGRGFREIFL